MLKGMVAKLGLAVAALQAVALVQAEGDPSRRGYQVAEEMARRDNGFQSYKMNMEMVLRDKQGQASSRQIRGSVLEVQGDGDKYIMLFETPADIRGTAFLSYSHSTKPDDQWLYLPSLKRTKRIASESKAGSFMGSEFAFEDMTSQELEKYDYSFQGDDKVGDRAAYRIERLPKYEGSGYTRQIVWVDGERYVPLRIEFYDRRNELLKTLRFDEYKLHVSRFWKAHKMLMENHQSGKSTVIGISTYQFRSNVSEQDFDPQRLEFIR